MKSRRYGQSLAAIYLATALGAGICTANAGAQITTGSNWLRVNWSDPGGKFQWGSPRYKVCIREGLWPFGTCSAKTIYTNSKPYTFTNLKCNKNYTVKVYARGKRKFLWWWGRERWHFRKYGVGKTGDCVPVGSIEASSTPDLSPFFSKVKVKVKLQNYAAFNKIRIGYKRAYWPTSLNGICKVRWLPPIAWPVNLPWRGWRDGPSGPTFEYEFHPLFTCKLYKFVAYAFEPGKLIGRKIGEVTFRIPGPKWYCWFRSGWLLRRLKNGHPGVFEQYATELQNTHGRSLEATLVQRFRCMSDTFKALREDGVQLGSAAQVLSVFVEARPRLYDEWQRSLAQRAPDLSTRGFLAAKHATLLAELEHESETPAVSVAGAPAVLEPASPKGLNSDIPGITGIRQIHVVPNHQLRRGHACALTVRKQGREDDDLMLGYYDPQAGRFEKLPFVDHLNTSSSESGLTLSPDLTCAVYSTPRGLRYATRARIGIPFGLARPVTGLASTSTDACLTRIGGRESMIVQVKSDLVAHDFDRSTGRLSNPRIVVRPSRANGQVHSPTPITDSRGDLIGLSHCENVGNDSDHYVSLDLDPKTPSQLMVDTPGWSHNGSVIGSRFLYAYSDRSGSRLYQVDLTWFPGARQDARGVLELTAHWPAGTFLKPPIAMLMLGRPMPPVTFDPCTVVGKLAVNLTNAMILPVGPVDATGATRLRIPLPRFPRSTVLTGQYAFLQSDADRIWLTNAAPVRIGG